MRHLRALGLLLAVMLATGCATARHVSTVSLVAAHGTLKTIDDTEQKAVCGVPEAPTPPLCVSVENHRKVSDLLARGFELDAQAARTIKAWPAGTPQPVELVQLTTEITSLVNQTLALLPDSAWKAKLIALLGGK